jgi:hypothetical protein
VPWAIEAQKPSHQDNKKSVMWDEGYGTVYDNERHINSTQMVYVYKPNSPGAVKLPQILVSLASHHCPCRFSLILATDAASARLLVHIPHTSGPQNGQDRQAHPDSPNNARDSGIRDTKANFVVAKLEAQGAIDDPKCDKDAAPPHVQVRKDIRTALMLVQDMAADAKEGLEEEAADDDKADYNVFLRQLLFQSAVDKLSMETVKHTSLLLMASQMPVCIPAIATR